MMRLEDLRDLTTLPSDRLGLDFRAERVLTVLPVSEPNTGQATILVATPTKLGVATLGRPASGSRWVTRWAPWDAVRLGTSAAASSEDRSTLATPGRCPRRGPHLPQRPARPPGPRRPARLRAHGALPTPGTGPARHGWLKSQTERAPRASSRARTPRRPEGLAGITRSRSSTTPDGMTTIQLFAGGRPRCSVCECRRSVASEHPEGDSCEPAAAIGARRRCSGSASVRTRMTPHRRGAHDQPQVGHPPVREAYRPTVVHRHDDTSGSLGLAMGTH